MTETSYILKLAKQGEPKALEALLSKHLKSKGIKVKVSRSRDSIKVALISQKDIDKKVLIPFISNGIKKLGIKNVNRLLIQASKDDMASSSWSHVVSLSMEGHVAQELGEDNMPPINSNHGMPDNPLRIQQKERKSAKFSSLWRERWEQAGVSEKAIIMSTLVATVSMFLPWVDLGFSVRSGFIEGSFLFLGLYIYPFWSTLQQKQMNKVWGLACAATALSYSIIYVFEQEMASLMGTTIFFLSSVGLCFGIYRSNGYWRNYWKEFDLKGKIILASVGLALLSIPLTWSYFQNANYDFESVRGYNIPEVLYMLFFLYPSVCLFRDKPIQKKWGLVSAVLALLFSFLYILIKLNNVLYSPLDEAWINMCTSEYFGCPEKDATINNTGWGIYIYFLASILLAIGVAFNKNPSRKYKI
jgi:hypothetical protein